LDPIAWTPPISATELSLITPSPPLSIEVSNSNSKHYSQLVEAKEEREGEGKETIEYIQNSEITKEYQCKYNPFSSIPILIKEETSQKG
jgi:hypothetical protein